MRALTLALFALIATPALADRFAVVDQAGAVLNVIEAQAGFEPGAGLSIVRSDTAAIGDAYANGGFTSPPTPPTPAAPKQLSFLEFMALFTSDEQAAIVNSTDTRVKLFLLMATGAKTIDPADARVTQGLDLLAGLTLITADREAAIKQAMQ